jgi:hypothetical protein
MHIIEGLRKWFSDEDLLRLYSDKSRLYEELFKAVYYGILPPNRKRTKR